MDAIIASQMPEPQMEIYHGLPTPPLPAKSPGCLKHHLPGASPPTPPPDFNDPTWEIKLQLSQLQQSLRTASLLDDQGYWSGRQEDEPLRLELQEISLRLQKMLTHPVDTIQVVAQAHHAEAALHYAVVNNIAEHVPPNGAITYADLGIQASLDQDQCRRILRLLISQYIFSETSSGLLTHSPASFQLLNPGMRAWVLYQTEDSLKASTHLTEALARWPSSLHKSETAYSLAHGTELSMFEHMSQNGKIGRFREAMSGNAKQPAFDTRHAVAGYPWQDLISFEPNDRKPLIVDVGGGIGHVSSAIASFFPSLDIRVQDFGVAEAYSKDGIHFSHYDFFTRQPIRNADVYFLRQILHDWSDEYAVQILRNQIQAMKPHSKLVLMDMVLQRPGDWTLSEERKSRMADMTMMTLFNAKEREMHEWLELVSKASDSRLALTRVARPVGSLISIMEFSFVV